MAKWVYLFSEGNANMRNLLGGKGANLAEMTNLGMPIPQGFTVTTEACTDYYNNGKKISEEIQGQIFDALAELEKIPSLSYRRGGVLSGKRAVEADPVVCGRAGKGTGSSGSVRGISPAVPPAASL